jgi:hypothetical protein
MLVFTTTMIPNWIVYSDRELPYETMGFRWSISLDTVDGDDRVHPTRTKLKEWLESCMSDEYLTVYDGSRVTVFLKCADDAVVMKLRWGSDLSPI